MNVLPPGEIALVPNPQIASLVQGDMRQLIMFLAAISIVSWVVVLATMIARLVMHIVVRRPMAVRHRTGVDKP